MCVYCERTHWGRAIGFVLYREVVPLLRGLCVAVMNIVVCCRVIFVAFLMLNVVLMHHPLIVL